MKKQPFVLLILLMLILCFAITLPASADIQSDIRVYLRRLAGRRYAARHGDRGSMPRRTARLSFSDGANLAVVLRGDQLVLHTGTNRRRYGQQPQAGAL